MDKKEKRKEYMKLYQRRRREQETIAQRNNRLDLLSNSQRLRLAQETSEERQKRIQMISENQRQRLAQETEEERRARIQMISEYQRQRLAQETEEERRARIQMISEHQRQRLAQETEEERRERIQMISENQRQRLAQETEEERRERIQMISEHQRQRLINESQEERQQRLETLIQNKRQRLEQETEEERSSRLNRESQIRSLRREEETEEERDQRLTIRRRVYHRNVHNFGVEYQRGSECILDESNIVEHHCGALDNICQFCQAKFFVGEKTSTGVFTQCCNNGKVKLQTIRKNDTLEELMKGSHEHSKNFKDHIRSINSSLAFASFGANIAPLPGLGPYCFRIHGSIYHRTGSLHPVEGESRQYAQLYILDPEEAALERMHTDANAGINQDLMTMLSQLINNINPFAEAYKMMFEVEQESLNDRNTQRSSKITMAIVQDRKDDSRRYNAPTHNEVAIIFQNADGEPPLHRDILIHCRPNSTDTIRTKTERISVLDPNLEPMVYPLFFPYGEQSWGIDIPLQNRPISLPRRVSQNPRIRVTQMQYYAYIFSIRDNFNPFLSGGKLTQQYFVDAYVKTEANRINYIKQNQSSLRVEKYKGLMDHLQGNFDCLPGIPIILPSSFQGSPRNMYQNYQDAMAIVRKYGVPDLFITMTCNPKWNEITRNLSEGQTASCRPDLVSRIFNIKLNSLLDDICKKHIFGIVVAKIHVIEFQKRGLPHAHVLIILKPESKPATAEDIEKIVSAEIPNKETHPRLYNTVVKHMVHGPCGQHNENSRCMVNGKCTKDFPKSFQPETLYNINGFPHYKRKDDGSKAIVNGKEIDNRWIVPYNPYLSLKYNCHINVEVCASIKSVKYMFKYVYKGHDCANIEINQYDEIKTYLDTRYVSAPEAAWRLFGFKMHHQSHSITRLAVHLPNEQNVVFRPNEIGQAVQNTKDSTLEAWFKLNQIDNQAQNHFYFEIPNHYVFENRNRIWKRRQRGGEFTIGRMYTVNMSSDIERYCLRLLLLHVKGATSFEHIRTVNGIVCDTFQEAARQLGLINNEEV